MAVEHRPNDYDKLTNVPHIPIGTYLNSPVIRLYTPYLEWIPGGVRKKSAYTSWAAASAHRITKNLTVLDFAPFHPICATIPVCKRRHVV